MNDSCTLYETLALLTGMDGATAQRYGAPPGVRDSGKQQYRLDVLYPSMSGLPGTEALYRRPNSDPSAGATEMMTPESADEDEARQQYAVNIGRALAAGRDRLDAALQSGTVAAYGSDGRIPEEFWLTHNVSSAEAQFFRWRRGDLRKLICPPDLAAESAQIAASSEPLIKGKRDDIRTAIKLIYDHAEAECMKPPNLAELPKHVLAVLKGGGKTATQTAIKEVAEESAFTDRRGKVGARVNGSLTAFSLPKSCKSGS